jgi:hypothetical protein
MIGPAAGAASERVVASLSTTADLSVRETRRGGVLADGTVQTLVHTLGPGCARKSSGVQLCTQAQPAELHESSVARKKHSSDQRHAFREVS